MHVTRQGQQAGGGVKLAIAGGDVGGHAIGRLQPCGQRRGAGASGLGGPGSGFAETLAEARRLILLGVGIGFLPTDVAEAAPGGALWPLLPAELLPGYDVYVVARPSDDLTTEARILFNHLRGAAEAQSSA